MISHNNDHHNQVPQEAAPRPSRWRKAFDGLFIAILAFSLGYLGWFGLQSTRSVARSLAGPDSVVRVQIVNSTGDPAVAKSVADMLGHYTDREISFAVVDTIQFTSRRVHQSFIISREDDQKTAKAVAARLGLTEQRISSLPLEHNNRNVSVTLVLGDDYHTLALAPRFGKETNRKT